jgi:hypothetical protein
VLEHVAEILEQNPYGKKYNEMYMESCGIKNFQRNEETCISHVS